MPLIKTFLFNNTNFDQIKIYHFGSNWPVVYIAENGEEAYIGETTSLYYRSKQHYENIEKQKLTRLHVISDEEFNKSAALDIEAWLIQYLSADGIFKLQNGNSGLKNHNYYDKEKYKAKFESLIWDKLKEKKLVNKDLVQLKNSDLFKYSPYKTLSDDQLIIVDLILKDLIQNKSNVHIITGKPGTGKTILAVFLFKYLKEKKETKNLKIAIVVPMTSLRSTIKKVFRNIKGLNSSMVIGPNDVVKEKYDLLIVDEAHRLRRRQNITNYRAFDQINKKLGLGNDGNELDWIRLSSSHQILFYDQGQTIRPSDLRPEEFSDLNAKKYELTTQMRLYNGERYIQFIEDLFDLRSNNTYSFPKYDFKIYDDINNLVKDIKQKDKEVGLSRVVAGYAWPWYTKKGTKDYDIEIDGLKLIWNSQAQDWINSPNAINEVGCIHTVQGYDLNYIGVIIGPELSYDENKKKFVVDREKYFDINGRNGITNPKELESYIINIYKTLLTRGIKGTYVYIVDENLKKYILSQLI